MTPSFTERFISEAIFAKVHPAAEAQCSYIFTVSGYTYILRPHSLIVQGSLYSS